MTAGRPRKPNEQHLKEGTARLERGTQVVLQIDKRLAGEPEELAWDKMKRNEVFKMFSDWVIKATGAVQIDSVMLTMMVDQLEIYARAKAEGNDKLMGATIDRFHRLAKEFGMTPTTRSHLVSAAVEKDKKFDFSGSPDG